MNDSSSTSISTRISPNVSIESKQLDEDEFSCMPFMTLSPCLVDTSALLARRKLQIMNGSSIDQQLQVTPPIPIVPASPDHVVIGSAGAEASLDISLPSAGRQSQFTDGPDVEQQLPVMAFEHNPPVSQQDVGIDPSLVFHEGWGCSQDTIASCSPGAEVAMNEDHDAGSGIGIAQDTMTLRGPVSAMEDIEMHRQSSVDAEVEEEEMERQASVDAEEEEGQMQRQASVEAEEEEEEQASVKARNDDVAMERESSVIPEDDIEMLDGGEQLSDMANIGIPQPTSGKCQCDLQPTVQLTHAWVDEVLPEVPKENMCDQFSQELPEQSNRPSKPNLRTRQTVLHYGENQTNVTKKRKGRSKSQSDSEADENDGDSFEAVNFQGNPMQEPETLKEFVSLL